MKDTIVLISIFRESVVGGIAVHSSNLFARILEEGLSVVKVSYSEAVNRAGIFRQFAVLLRVAGQLFRLRWSGARLFHFHASNRAFFFYLFAPLLYLSGARIFLSLHSGFGYAKWLDLHPLYHRLNTVFLRMLDRLIFMNPEERNHVQARYPFLAERIITINPFIAPPAAELPNIALITPAPDRMTILTVGAWRRRYNVEEAVLAAVRFARKSKASTTLILLLATADEEVEYRRELEAIITEAQRHITVEVVEDASNILTYFARADLSIRPAHLDSYGLCVAESLLVGTPAIATDVCRRCAQALTYSVGDADTLDALVDKVWKGRHQERQVLLEKAEDSFHQYLQEYQRIIGPSPKQ